MRYNTIQMIEILAESALVCVVKPQISKASVCTRYGSESPTHLYSPVLMSCSHLYHTRKLTTHPWETWGTSTPTVTSWGLRLFRSPLCTNSGRLIEKFRLLCLVGRIVPVLSAGDNTITGVKILFKYTLFKRDLTPPITYLTSRFVKASSGRTVKAMLTAAR